jgi:hypothetical protein
MSRPRQICIAEVVCKAYSFTEMYVDLLRLIPVAPKTITYRELREQMVQRGWPCSKRTVERAMNLLGSAGPLEYTKIGAQYHWSWKAGTEFCSRSKRNLRGK